jgi:AcrR family transcriptional regulator
MNKNIESGQATRQQIIAVATRLFASQGYEATSIDSVLLRCAVSRGALYHHFDSKEALFAAVLEGVESDVARALIKASRRASDPIDALRDGCYAWLHLARDDTVRQIVLIDAPTVVGWRKWREIDARHGFGLLKGGLKAVAAAGHLPSDLVDMFAHVLLAALIEVSLLIASAESPEAATRSGRAAIGELINRLLGVSAAPRSARRR